MKKINWMFAGMGLLFLGSFLDNIRGPLLPVMAGALDLDYSRRGLFLTVGCISASLINLFLIRVFNRFELKSLGFFAIAMALSSALFALTVGNFLQFLFLAAGIGMSISSFGALSNLFVMEGTEPSFRTRAFCGLHLMYGLGSIFSPLLVTEFLSRGWTWSQIFASAALPIFLLALYLAFSVSREKAELAPRERHRYHFLHLFSVAVFIIYVVGEVAISMWMVSYLSDAKKLDLLVANRYALLFFVMIAITRSVCFFRLPEHLESVLMYLSIFGALLFFSMGVFLNPVWLPLSGVIGPFFPIYLSTLTKRFPREGAQLTLWLSVGVQVALAFSHFGLGFLANRFGIGNSYLAPIVFLILTAMGLRVFQNGLHGARVAESVDARDLKSLG